ncbi:fimbrial protein [Pseudomonas mucidolens]|uniref:Major type 1 subunit fimbrin (Pilin) n=1 Tax=Pseudomonas mucidolens TaxID=46679 RepID=A0A1H2N8S2_9PSED|nr:fimbrial protein [Pseudomonas mucidolens]SDV01879.1 major type 1 subunit fimbrin (pilin) [Pseudomonas mucidolens]SQH32414.1 fimbrial subunit protein [Pseudomonas mucidolens]
MKKVLIALAASAAVATSFNASAADGTINFTGEVSSQTCAIEGNTTDATTKTVTLPRVAASSLATVGQTAGRTGFTLALTGCTGSSALVRFEQGPTVDAATGNLINQTTSGSNAQIQLLNASFAPINLQTNDGSLSSAITTKAATLQFYAQYIAANAAATAGQVTSNVQFSMDYN